MVVIVVLAVGDIGEGDGGGESLWCCYYCLVEGNGVIGSLCLLLATVVAQAAAVIVANHEGNSNDVAMVLLSLRMFCSIFLL